jgi:phosphate transport system substrate-binding protein
MLKGLKHALACTAVITSILTVPAHATTTSKEIRWVGCGISRAGFMQDLADAYQKKTGIKVVIDGGGATRGIRDVAKGASDLGGSCRLPLVYQSGDGRWNVESQERHVKMIPVGWDALVVIVHKENRMLDNISQQQLRDIYTGKITTWRELGANSDQPINLYARDGKISGVERTMRQLLFNNPELEFTVRAASLPSSGKIEEAVEKDPYGLAVSGFSSSSRKALKPLNLDGVTPTRETVKSGKYMLYRLLFLVAGDEYRANPDVAKFIDYALSAEGQRVIDKAGTLPYRHGLNLMHNGLSPRYVQALDVVEQSGLYSPTGQ